MDFQSVYSFEQRSTLASDATRVNRVIIANRREPGAYWSNLGEVRSASTCCDTTSIKLLVSRFVFWWCSLFRFCFRCRQKTNSNRFSSNDIELKHIHRKHILADSQQESFDFETGPFPSNELTTSKYTLLNFLPKNLFEQFRRLANFYFLTTALIQTVIPYSPIGPATSLLPLFFVVATTAIKQAYEDYLRHKLDREVNNRVCCILRNKRLQRVRSKDIKVGDIVFVKSNEEIPCDLILLASSSGISAHSDAAKESSGGDRCYITTANLDGETSLKSRTCFAIRQQIGTIRDIDNSLLVIECEKPNATLYEFNGFIRAPKDADAYNQLVKELEDELSSLLNSNESIKARSSQAQAAAQDDKNSSGVPHSTVIKSESKTESGTLTDRSSSNDQSKRLSIIQTIFKRIRRDRKSRQAKKLAQITAKQLKSLGADHIIQSLNGADIGQQATGEAQNYVEIPLDISNLLPRAARLRNTDHIYGLVVYTGQDTRLAHNSQVKPNKFSSLESRVNMYLVIAFIMLLAFTLVSAMRSFEIPHAYRTYNSGTDETATRREHSFVEIILAHFVLYNYLVPISLYVTLEFVKFIGTLSVLSDKKLQVEAEKSERTTCTMQKTLLDGARSPRATRKPKPVKMVGAQCNSSDLNEDLGQVEVLFSDKTGTLTENKMRFMACSISSELYRLISGQLYQQPEGLCALPVNRVSRRLAAVRSNRYAAIGSQIAASSKARSKSSIASTGTAGAPSPRRIGSSMSSERLNQLPTEQRPFDHRVLPNLSQLKALSELEQQSNKVAEFFISLCLCSTITLNEQLDLASCLPDKVKAYDLQSVSPDEEALISAASSLGIIVCKSNERECFIAIQRSRPWTKKNLSPRELDQAQGQIKVRHGPGSQTNKRSQEVTAPNGTFRAILETRNSTEFHIVRHFERLLTFEFTSARKKMSVIYRDCDNNCLVMITKGSENVLDCIRMAHMSADQERVIDSTLAHFEAFSKSGLRTMLVARRLISKQELEQIFDNQREARLMPTPADREQQLASIARQAESNMQLVGATAVEDSLQDGVPETIADLKAAGIKVWLLTGDKVETAISVAYLCKLLDRDMNLLHLVRQQDSRTCIDTLINYQTQLKTLILNPTKQQAARNADEGGTSKGSHHLRGRPKGISIDLDSDELPRFALVADGRSLHYAMKYCKTDLSFVCKHCTCVLGCRLSPLQKAEIVEMIKSGEGGPICAAIGDGANDVSMIQEAHVGIGIRGREGRQAVNCSDFAINRFHMLNRLFFVHGHLFYHRAANTIHYFFYKNMLFVLPQFIYSFFSETGANSLYIPIMLITFNLFFTSAPILCYGLFEVNIPKSQLEDDPKLYRLNRKNRQMRYIVFLSWILLGALQAAIAFLSLYYTYELLEEMANQSLKATKLGFSIILFFVIVFTATMRLYFISQDPGYLFYITAILSCLLLPVIFYLTSLFSLSNFFSDNSLYQGFEPLAKMSGFWILIALTAVATLVPDVIIFLISRYMYKR